MYVCMYLSFSPWNIRYFWCGLAAKEMGEMLILGRLKIFIYHNNTPPVNPNTTNFLGRKLIARTLGLMAFPLK